ncbi:MAG TPA: metal ABC transporter permease [Acidimicrobiales bacterium]
MHYIFEAAFFSSVPVRNAAELGAVVSLVSAVVGVFTVIRSQSFAGHALTDVATSGGAVGAFFGINALAGFIGGAVVGAGSMELIGVQRARRRDVATGIVLGAATGISALYLYLDTTSSASTGVTQQILFGSIFSVAPSTLPEAALAGAGVLIVVATIWRPLLLSSLSYDVASARGIPTRAIGVVFMLAMSVSVGLSSLAIGSILSTALLIGPAAAALRVTRSVRAAVVVSCVLGVVATWLGILLAYDSYDWEPSSQGLPVSFFVVVVVVAMYLVSGLAVFRRRALVARGGAALRVPEAPLREPRTVA